MQTWSKQSEIYLSEPGSFGKRVRFRAVWLAMGMIRFYQRYLSILKPPTCRFTPTCSQYALQAIGKYGLAKGIYLGVRRLLRCHPFHPGGWDPVP